MYHDAHWCCGPARTERTNVESRATMPIPGGTKSSAQAIFSILFRAGSVPRASSGTSLLADIRVLQEHAGSALGQLRDGWCWRGIG